jgi:BioD-like phosphotransacetylase family protein
MSVVVVTSSQPRAGRSTIAAAIAYRLARDGKRVMLARLAGDESAEADARAFAEFDAVSSPGRPLRAGELTSTDGDALVVEAPPGPLPEGVPADVKTIAVAAFESGAPASGGSTAMVATGVPAEQLASVRSGSGVIAALPEDRLLAAPSSSDIASALDARWLVESPEEGAIERVMIGTVASDAASPYFASRERKCVVTRYDKTDIQLAALLTDLELLVLTGGGQPSPYLLDRVASAGAGVSVLLVEQSTVDAVRQIEALYRRSRFRGRAKLERAVALLDEVEVTVEI